MIVLNIIEVGLVGVMFAAAMWPQPKTPLDEGDSDYWDPPVPASPAEAARLAEAALAAATLPHDVYEWIDPEIGRRGHG